MKGLNRKFIVSIFISIIAICYVSLAISYAWFFANRAQDNAANNLKIVNFDGGIFYYHDNYEYDEEGNPTDYKGFQGNQTFDNTKEITDKFVSGAGAIMTMPDMLPNVRFLYLVKLKHNYESSIKAHFYINNYISYLGVKKADGSLQDQSECPKDIDRSDGNGDYDYVSLSEAINIYIGNTALKLNETSDVDLLQTFVNDKTLDNERFHERSGDLITTNIDNFMDTSRNGVPLLHSVDIPPSDESNEFYYVPVMFEFSNNSDTYYISTSVDGKDGNYFKHSTDKGNSNVYKNLTFEIKEFEITPYTK